MKVLILLYSVWAVAVASSKPNHEKYQDLLDHPKIVPVETAALQHARMLHLIALAAASQGYGDKDYRHYNEHDSHNNSSTHQSLNHHEHEEYYHKYNNDHQQYEYHGHEDDGHYHDDKNQKYNNHKVETKWQGPLHYPKIYKGVPIEPKEVQHAREAHLATHHVHQQHDHNHLAKIYKGHTLEHTIYHNDKFDYNNHESPVIAHDGTPLDTTEVQAAKAKHFAAVKEALARNSHHH